MSRPEHVGVKGNGVGAPSIRRRTGLAFGLFAAALLGSLSLGTVLTLADTEDDVLHRRVEVELETIRRQLGLDPSSRPVPEDPAIRAHWSLQDLPFELRRRVEREPASTVRLEVQDGELYEGSPNLFILLEQLESGPLVLVFDAQRFEVQEQWPYRLARVLLLGLGVCLVTTLLITGGLTRFVVAPLERLEGALRGDPEGLRDRLDRSSAPKEIEGVVDALQGSLSQLEARAEQERRFAQRVSHELRTPVSVIRSSAELLNGQLEGRPLAQLQRISRSATSMQSTIEALLWLARPQASQAQHRPIRVRGLVEECLLDLAEELSVNGESLDRPRPQEQVEPLEPSPPSEPRTGTSPGRTVEGVVVEVPDELTYSVSEPYLRMIVLNLLRNAFEHGEGGPVRVVASEKHLEVSDSGPGFDAELGDGVLSEGVSRRENGTGIGLALLSELCRRFGWHLHLGDRVGGGAVARVVLGLGLRLDENEAEVTKR